MRISPLFYIFYFVILLNPIFGISQHKENHIDVEERNRFDDRIHRLEKKRLTKKLQKVHRRLRKKERLREEANRYNLDAIETDLLKIKEEINYLEKALAALHNVGEDEQQSTEIDPKVEADIDSSCWYCKIKRNRRKRPYNPYKNTTSDLVVAFGLNNAFSKNTSIEDAEYRYIGSRFFELGWAWTSNVHQRLDFFRIKYGLSFQFNGLKPYGNQFFIKEGSQIKLADFDYPLTKSKLLNTNLVFPLHFEFGNTQNKKRTTIDGDVYHRNNYPIILGLGGYVGFQIDSFQKLKYRLEGSREKQKLREDLNMNKFVYGISFYMTVFNVAIYTKYDLSPIFKNQKIPQHNISLGVRFDIL